MKFYTIKEVAEMLRVDELTIYKLIDNKELKAFRPGRKFLITEEQIKEFLNKSLTA